jgi:hypothetical protein
MTILNKMALAIGLSATKVDPIYPANYVADLDGVNDFVQIADNNALTPNASGADRGFTVSAWVYYKTTSNPARGHYIFNKQAEFHSGAYRYEWKLNSGFDEQPFMRVYSGDDVNIFLSFKLDLTPSHSTWYHLIFAWNLGTGTGDWKAFVNGSKQTHGSGATHSSGGTWGSVANGANTLILGSNNENRWGNMKMDEVAIFDDYISDSDAAALYNSGSPGDATEVDNLVAYWKFNEASGTSVEDSSSNSNTATFVNGTAFEQLTIS